MKTERINRMMGAGLALLVLALALVVVGLVLAGDVRAATPAPTLSAVGDQVKRDAIVRFGEDIVVPAGERVDGAVAFGGDITVDGTVVDAVVAFGGDITIAGTVNGAIVAFGGDVRLLPTAVVGVDVKPGDASVVLFGGSLTKEPGAEVTGGTEVVEGPDWGAALSWLGERTFVHPWWGFTWAGWLVQTAFFLVLALVAAALMPGQLRAVQRKLAAQPGPSLGWGALTFFVIVPLTLIVLVVSIVGLLVVIPAGLALLLAYFFATTAVAAYIAERVLGGSAQKDNLMLSVALGVVGTTIVSRIPVVGALALVVMMVMGTGAACLAVVDWRRERRLAAAPPAPPAPPGAPAAVTSAEAPLPAPPGAEAAQEAPTTALPAVEAAQETPAGESPTVPLPTATSPAVESPADGPAAETAFPVEPPPAIDAPAAMEPPASQAPPAAGPSPVSAPEPPALPAVEDGRPDAPASGQ